MGNNTVTIGLEKYERLVAAEARCNILTDYTLRNKYSVEREVIASILGFELPGKAEEDE
ncbi:hypothetical protein [Lacrimispora sp.]|uniref:hypothetical protein n=1 Tax=Lacrimispora sp. TaxID=2719234 RepID=UPI002FD9B7C2